MRLGAHALVAREHDGQAQVAVMQQAPHEVGQALLADYGDLQDLLVIAQAPGQAEMLLKDLRRGFPAGIDVPAVGNAIGVVGNAIEIDVFHYFPVPNVLIIIFTYDLRLDHFGSVAPLENSSLHLMR